MKAAEYENVMRELRRVNENLEKIGALLERMVYPPQELISYDNALPRHRG